MVVEAMGLADSQQPLAITLNGPKTTFVIRMLMCLMPPPLQTTHQKRSEEANSRPRGDMRPPGQIMLRKNEAKVHKKLKLRNREACI